MPTTIFEDFSHGKWIPPDAETGAAQSHEAVPQKSLVVATNIQYRANGSVRGRRGQAMYAENPVPERTQYTLDWGWSAYTPEDLSPPDPSAATWGVVGGVLGQIQLQQADGYASNLLNATLPPPADITALSDATLRAVSMRVEMLVSSWEDATDGVGIAGIDPDNYVDAFIDQIYARWDGGQSENLVSPEQALVVLPERYDNPSGVSMAFFVDVATAGIPVAALLDPTFHIVIHAAAERVGTSGDLLYRTVFAENVHFILDYDFPSSDGGRVMAVHRHYPRIGTNRSDGASDSWASETRTIDTIAQQVWDFAGTGAGLDPSETAAGLYSGAGTIAIAAIHTGAGGPEQTDYLVGSAWGIDHPVERPGQTLLGVEVAIGLKVLPVYYEAEPTWKVGITSAHLVHPDGTTAALAMPDGTPSVDAAEVVWAAPNPYPSGLTHAQYEAAYSQFLSVTLGSPTEALGMTTANVLDAATVFKFAVFGTTTKPESLWFHVWVTQVQLRLYFEVADSGPIVLAAMADPTVDTAADETPRMVWIANSAAYPDMFTQHAVAAMPDDGVVPAVVAWPQFDSAYLFDGTNPMSQFDGVSIRDVEPDLATDAPKRGPIACLWQFRLWATDPAEREYSVYASNINDPRNWDSTQQLSINDAGAGQITGLRGFGRRLVILKETSAWAFTGDFLAGPQLGQYSNVGCVAPATVAATPWGVIYLGARGLFLTDGQNPEPEELSLPIQPLFVSRETQHVYPNAVGVFVPRLQAYLLCLDPLASGQVLAVFRLIVQTPRGPSLRWAWADWTFSFTAACTADGRDDDGDLYLGTLNGQLWRGDENALDADYSYIPCEIVTASRQWDRMNRSGRAYRVKPTYRAQTALGGAIRYDDALVDSVDLGVIGSDLPAAEMQDPRVTVVDQSHFGRSVAVRMANLVDGPEFELFSIEVDFMRRSTRRWD